MPKAAQPVRGMLPPRSQPELRSPTWACSPSGLGMDLVRSAQLPTQGTALGARTRPSARRQTGRPHSEPCRGRDRQNARPWEQAPGWEDRADMWAPLALMPGQTGQLGGSFRSVGTECWAWSCEWPVAPSRSHGCPQPRPLHRAGICLFTGTRSQPYGT